MTASVLSFWHPFRISKSCVGGIEIALPDGRTCVISSDPDHSSVVIVGKSKLELRAQHSSNDVRVQFDDGA